MSKNSVFEIGKQYVVTEYAVNTLEMYYKNGEPCLNSNLIKGEIVTLEKDNIFESDFMLTRENGEVSDRIFGDQFYLYIEEIEINKDIKIEDLKPGMKVRLKDDLIEGEHYGDDTFEGDLNGEIVTVKTISEEFDMNSFRIKENSWNYTPEMVAEIIEDSSEEKLQEIEAENTKVDNNKVVNENQINYEDEYNRIVEMYKELTQENEDLKKALVKIALKL